MAENEDGLLEGLFGGVSTKENQTRCSRKHTWLREEFEGERNYRN